MQFKALVKLLWRLSKTGLVYSKLSVLGNLKQAKGSDAFFKSKCTFSGIKELMGTVQVSL